jgi:hypothetical protein
MSHIRFRIRTIMIAIAAVAVLLSLVRVVSQYAVLLGISFGLLLFFGTSACILVSPFAVDWLAGAQNRTSSRFLPPRDERNETGEGERA